MSVTIRPIRVSHPTFAGEVTGIDLRQSISPSDVAAIEAGMDTYAVLVFHDQDITDEQQIAFSRNFGELESYKTPRPSPEPGAPVWVPAWPISRT